MQNQGSASGGTAYTFTQQPQPVATRSKYRDPFSKTQNAANNDSSNIMWDRRVYRGNTYAAQVLPVSAQAEIESRKRKERAAKRRKIEEEKRVQMEQERAEANKTPDAVQGRKHMDIQTEQYLEEITDRVIEVDAFTETDPFMDRPETPKFIPPKAGIDKNTQVEEDLFDFDFEVDPILEVLVGKTLEQSLLEVLEEEEMLAIKKKKEEFEQKRNAELVEVQRIEGAERRRYEEKERRKLQERERKQREKIAKEKLASRTYAKTFLRNLQTNLFNNLQEQGYFFDVVQRQIETDFLPWLTDKVQEDLDKKRDARDAVDALIKTTLKKMLFASHNAREDRKEREEQERLLKIKLAEEAEKKRQEEEKKRLEEEQAKLLALQAEKEKLARDQDAADDDTNNPDDPDDDDNNDEDNDNDDNDDDDN